MSPYLRTVKTSSGATAVQIVHSSRRGSRDIEHLGSAHDDVELELLKAAARQRLAAGQGVLDLGLDTGAPGGPLPITASRMGCLLDALERAYRVLGFDQATAGDEVFFQLVAGADHRAGQQAGQRAGAGGSGRGAGAVPDRDAAAARVREGFVAAADLRGLRRARRAGPGEPGAI